MPNGKYAGTLGHPGFQPFLWTQFLGAFNDNMCKIVVSMIAVNEGVGSGSGGAYVSMVGAVFIVPFFLFSGYAGYLADVQSKRRVLIMTKGLEVLAMGAGFFAFLSGRIELLLGILFLMALQSTFFSPAKYGILPEMLPTADLSRANGLLEMSTFLAIILGTSIGSMMFAAWRYEIHRVGLILFSVAVVGAWTSLGIRRVAPSGSAKSFRLNPWSEIVDGTKRIYRDKPLWLTVLGISYFWFLGALLQMDLLLLAKEVLGLDDLWTGVLATFLAMGIAVGSLAAGRLSGDKVELGLVPLGAIGVSIFSLLLASSAPSYVETAIALVMLGGAGGFFAVPLYAFLQQRSGEGERGRLIATSNFFNTAGILMASGTLWAVRDLLGISADRIILIFGVITLVATLYVLAIMPETVIRFLLWMLTHTVYKIRVSGQEHFPTRGPALLVCNHVSYADAILLGASVPRAVRFVMHRSYHEVRAFRWLFRLMRVIPVSAESPREILRSLDVAREGLRQGDVICIFAEGAISRTGNLLPFKRGFERIIEGLDVPVVPVYLDRLWGSIFSFKGGRFFWKLPARVPYPVTVVFGKPMRSGVTAHLVRQAVQELGSAAVEYRRDPRDLLHLRFIKLAKRRWFSFCAADSSGKELTYGKALVGGMLLSKWIRKHVGEEAMVGLVLPASVGGLLANLGVLLAGKVAVNLNFTAGPESMKSAIGQCGIRTILTSRLFLSRAKLAQTGGMVFLEDVMEGLSPLQKIWTGLVTFLLPANLLSVSRKQSNPYTLATVIFSSGSTGEPKGVMLSHHNIISNVEGIGQVIGVTTKDRILGVLPLFHSFGFTVTLWFPLLSGFGAVYHPNPLDGAAVGQLVRSHKVTILVSTPTFCGSYLKKCSSEDFSSLRFALVGAEKLHESLAIAFKEKYGLELLEGYGCTELAPVVSANVPDRVDGALCQIGLKRGTVGHPIPGVTTRVVHPDTRQPLAMGEEGLLLIKGPNLMMGYLGKPEVTREALQDGWYITGDIGSVDEDGFITITDRLARFSKIGGEMVPHLKVEEEINKILGDHGCVVTALPDEQKGERLVVLFTNKEVTAEEIWKRLCETKLSRLWIPRRESLHRVEAIPLLGTGKVDLRKAKAMALEMEGRDP